VWKKEIGPHGEEWVEGHYTPASSDRTADGDKATGGDQAARGSEGPHA
jgi:hypothetical protein